MPDELKVLGGQGVLVTSDENLEPAISDVANRIGSILIELKLDPTIVPQLHL